MGGRYGPDMGKVAGRVGATLRAAVVGLRRAAGLDADLADWWVETVEIRDVAVGDRIEETVWLVGSAVPTTGTVVQVGRDGDDAVLIVALDSRLPRLSGTVKEIEVRRPAEQWVKRLRRRDAAT